MGGGDLSIMSRLLCSGLIHMWVKGNWNTYPGTWMLIINWRDCFH